jgi:hypothetical protein
MRVPVMKQRFTPTHDRSNRSSRHNPQCLRFIQSHYPNDLHWAACRVVNTRVFVRHFEKGEVPFVPISVKHNRAAQAVEKADSR